MLKQFLPPLNRMNRMNHHVVPKEESKNNLIYCIRYKPSVHLVHLVQGFGQKMVGSSGSRKEID